MLSVQAPIEHGRQEIFSEQNSIQEQDEIPMEMPTKQQLKKQVITPTRVLIAVAILCILALGSYKVYTIAFPATTESKMDLTHSKIISVAESSSGKDTNSNSGSQSSKSSQDSGKPIGVAKTVGKDVISSNIQGGSGNGGDDKDPNQQDNDGEKRKKHLDKNAKDGAGTSTEDETEQQSEEDDEDSGVNDGQVGVWPNNGGSENVPLVGKTRN